MNTHNMTEKKELRAIQSGLAMGVTILSLWLSPGSQGDAVASDWIPTEPGFYSWNESANWSGGVPNSQGAVANFTRDIAGRQTNMLNQASLRVGTITIGDSNASHPFVISTNAAGQTLTLDNGGTPALITQIAGSAGDTLALPLVFTSGLVISNAAAASKNLTLQGDVSGTGTLRLESAANNAVVFFPLNNLTIPNNIVGGGILGKAGPKSLRLTGNNAAVLKSGYSITGGGPLILSGGVFSNAVPKAADLPFGAAGNTFILENGAKYYCATGGVVMNSGYSSCTTLVTGAGTLWDGGYNNQYGITRGGTLVVANGAVMTNFLRHQIGSMSSDNSLVITNGGRIVYSVLSGGFGIGYNASRNSVLVEGRNSVSGDEAMWIFMGGGGQQLMSLGSYNSTSMSNSVTVGRGGVITNVSGIAVGQNGYGNRLVVTNGGRLYGAGAPFRCGGSEANNWGNTIWVGGRDRDTGIFSTLNIRSELRVGEGQNSNSNLVWICEGGMITNVTKLSVGYHASANFNRVFVTASGFLGATAEVIVGMGGNIGNTLTMNDNSTLECTAMTVNSGSGNLIAANNSTYQFTSATPNIANYRGPEGIALNNGVVSFRNVKGVDIFGNQTGNLSNIAFSGNNAFRLNNAANSTTAPQSYVFNTGGAPAYAGLELFNGNTAYTNGSVTTASAGWLTFSNTVATMWGAVTNNGTLRIIDSTVNFKNDLVLGSACTLEWKTNSTMMVTGTVKLPDIATLNILSPPDVSDCPLPLLTSSTAIAGSTQWTVRPRSLQVFKSSDGRQLIVGPATWGTTVLVVR